MIEHLSLPSDPRDMYQKLGFAIVDALDSEQVKQLEEFAAK